MNLPFAKEKLSKTQFSHNRHPFLVFYILSSSIPKPKRSCFCFCMAFFFDDTADS
jgi:SET domain-containing protein